MIPTLQTHIPRARQTNLARITREICLQLAEILPEHVARDNELLVLLESLYFGSEVLHEIAGVQVDFALALEQ